MNLRVDLILRQLVEDFELFRLKIYGGAGVDGGVVVFRVMVEPAEFVGVELLSVFVGAGADVEGDVGAGALFLVVEEAVDAADLIEGADDAVQWKNAVAVGVADE